jgi:hypothetical protein
MAKAVPGLNYEQLLAMISDLQWLPEKRCIRLALEGDQDGLQGNPVFGCLNRFCGLIDRNAQQDPLTGRTIKVLFSKLAMQYELIQHFDGDSVVTEVNRLVETIGVNLVLIGFSNGYSTALALVLRTRFPLEWNNFCDFAERQSWKINPDQVETRSRSESGAGFRRQQARGLSAAVDDAHEPSVADTNTGVPTGLRQKTELEEEDEDDLISGAPVAATNTAGRTHEWRFKKFKLR